MIRNAALSGLMVMSLALLACRKKNPPPPPPPPPMPSAVPEPPAPPKTVSVGGLEIGRHACVMQDGTGAYNRICSVSERVDGTLHVNAAGGALNPDIKFHLDATGGPESYQISGKMTAFDSCSGSYTATLARESIGGSEWFVAKFKHCKIMMRVEML